MRRSLGLPTVAALALAGLVACGAPTRVSPPARATFAFTHVRVFDGQRTWNDVTVLIDGDRIVALAEGLVAPDGAAVIDGRGKTLLPGLFDAHAHVYDPAQLEQSLAFGVTTVLDMFALPDGVKALKGDPRPDRAEIWSAGILATAPGGHGTEYGFTIPTLSTPAEAQAFVDARLAEGSDYLKIVFDDGRAYGAKIPTLDTETVRALIAAAHARKRLAVVHAVDYEKSRLALEAGADGLVHLFRDVVPADDFGKLAAAHHAFVTPTLAVLRASTGARSLIGEDPAIAPYLSPASRAAFGRSFSFMSRPAPGATEKAIALLRAAGVPILVGTDAPNPGTTYGATVHDELALLVAAGVPATEALAGATALPAQRFALADRGVIAEGKRADLVLVDGDPTTRIEDTRKIVGIWHAGVRFDRDGYRERIGKEVPAVAARAGGPVSDFEDGKTSVEFGQEWMVSTDALIGGKSVAKLTVVDGGAAASKKALVIEGTVTKGGAAQWAGAMFSPGAAPFTATDLTKTPNLVFQAKGDGKTYVVMVFAGSRGRAPLVQTFVAGKDFAPVRFSWKQFDGIDGSDVMAILIGHTEPGDFRLVVDDVRIE
jgi:imidazolonepropionase-like amidohydrolase